MSFYSSPNSAAQYSVSAHFLDSFPFITSCFENGGRDLWPTSTYDDVCARQTFPRTTIIPSSVVDQPSDGHLSSPFPFASSCTASNSQMLNASTLHDFELKSTPDNTRISCYPESQVQNQIIEASSSRSINLQPPESSNALYHAVIPPKRPEERDPSKYISIVLTKEGKPLFKCCWNGCPGVTFWGQLEVNPHVHQHFIQKQHECVCGATFSTKMSARRHCREQGKKNTCPGCLRPYTRKNYLGIRIKKCKGKEPSADRLV
ncbi:hypothetical protein M422DRAFT_276680 [Sphaerobolus stellatus SS14]|uniref:Unplaced genomic scaffold SPHSTscaffold_842, whole genome shotgun sequence n=1 Tax=Sphaerobolus stellatus (strain SS14) TaxID=990650 RepID=A0A0C9U1F5_SPHS4|nr:hypothetical protein M422DRAFT_276680 [Sphaerobolus stellatus SS14]